MRRSFRSFIPGFLAVACFFLGIPGLSQINSKQDESGTKPLEFEVVSIRPSTGTRHRNLAITADGYEAIGMPLETTLLIAYTPAPFFKHFEDVKGLPSWASDDKYDIEAKVAPTDVARWRDLDANIMRTSTTLQHMLQAVLVERCKLKVHYGETMTTGYALVLQHGPLQLKEDSTLPVGEKSFELLDGARGVISMQNGEQIFTFYNISMPVFANFLTMSSKQTVEDRTDLRGRYKFSLRRVTDTPPADNTAPQVDLAMPWNLHSLGMSTSKEKIKTRICVVDSLEKPSSN